MWRFRRHPFFTEVLSCVSLRFSPLLELEVLQEEERVRQQEGCSLSSTSASVVFRQLLGRFTSDQLCSASRRTLRAYTNNSFVGSDQMFVCEFALAEPHARYPPVKQLRCGLPGALSHL